MTSSPQPAARRPVAIAAALTALAVALLASFALAAQHGSGAPPRAGAGCPDADQPADAATAVELRRSVRCLINVERAVRGRAKLARSTALQSAAQRHAEVMVESDCLAHRCGDEPDLAARLERSGYLDGADAWQYAESTGCGASASAMVSNWMASRFHRVNILEKMYRDVGVGLVQQPVVDRCDKGYATFAVVFGWRTPPAEGRR
jgi:uncharacterized protein YkwD